MIGVLYLPKRLHGVDRENFIFFISTSLTTVLQSSTWARNLLYAARVRDMTMMKVCVHIHGEVYRLILSVLDPRRCEYLKDCSLDFEHAYMTTYLAS